jgi:hypothetical protein
MAANAEPEWTEGPIEEEGFLGLPRRTWVGIAAAAVVVGIIVGIAASDDDGGGHEAPVCP